MLDEADQLLQTAAVATQHAKRRGQVAAQGSALTARQRGQLGSLEQSPTELLLAELPRPVAKLQLICATATVGRTLRRQLQALLGSPSIEKAVRIRAWLGQG